MNDADLLDIVLLVMRIAGGVTLFLHGYQKVFLGGKLKGTAGWFESLGMRPGMVHAYLAAATEMGCGTLFAFGILTPFAAAGFVGLMLVAAWTHKDKFFVFKDGYEYNVILGLFAVLVATIGPGRFSVDRLLGIDDSLDSLTGLAISVGGLLIGGLLLLVAWRPPARAPDA